MSFGTAGTVADGGKTTKGWRVLGVGSIPSVTSASGQSTEVPTNSAYILAEDQDGVGAAFSTSTGENSRNFFDSSTTRNRIANTSDTFASTSGRFSVAELGAVKHTTITGVCNVNSGCTSGFGLASTINPYYFYPPSHADMVGSTNGNTDPGIYFNSNSARIILTTNTTMYHTRSPMNDPSPQHTQAVDPKTGAVHRGGTYDTPRQFGFRPAGVLNLESVLLSESRTDSRSDSFIFSFYSTY